VVDARRDRQAFPSFQHALLACNTAAERAFKYFDPFFLSSVYVIRGGAVAARAMYSPEQLALRVLRHNENDHLVARDRMPKNFHRHLKSFRRSVFGP
jgi:hypothetical protein